MLVVITYLLDVLRLRYQFANCGYIEIVVLNFQYLSNNMLLLDSPLIMVSIVLLVLI